MGKIDKNSTIGFIVLGVLLLAYIFFNQRSEQAYEAAKKAREDSIALVHQHVADSLGVSVVAKADTTPKKAVAVQPVKQDTANIKGQYGVFAAAATPDSGSGQMTTVESDLLRITFSSKGARPAKVQLKTFKAYTGGPLMLQDAPYNNLGLEFMTTGHKLINTADLNFQLAKDSLWADSSREIQYRLYAGSQQQYLQYTYVIHPGKYMLDFNIEAIGMQGLISPADGKISMVWHSQANQQEKDSSLEQRYTQMYYGVNNEELDYFTLERTPDQKVDQPVQWLSFKQQFFNQAFIAKKNFTNVSYESQVPKDSGGYIARTTVRFGIPYTPSADFSFPMRVYYGPNDYYILKAYHLGLENVIPLGYGLYAFAKYINKWMFLPLFVFLGKLFGGNWGIVIVFMTVVIRLLIAPLTYKSYVSQAKMKALKPELDELKAKFKGDQQKFGMEQMKLYRQVGVSPLGGCMPMLLQLPIFAGLYCLFESCIQVRGQSFLWVKDLSMYDSIAHLPFNIPFYGDHVSLLTLLMTVTSLVLALFNKNMTSAAAGQDNPMIKYMPYMMPIFFLGFFNSMAAALTLYYFISNLITIIIQWVIMHYIIDEKKLHAQMQEHKKRKPQKSKLMQRIEQAQKQQAQKQQAVSQKGRSR
ncbi:MAG TPA: membrane protein insertase YidC [Chitinophagaceae bacterium]|nr:membrane protein insertase YidC [Chitinophagaceae bacterium]